MNASKAPQQTQPRNFDFVVMEGYSGLSLISAIETLQNANLVSGETLYSWRILGCGADDVRSSTGQRLDLDGDLLDLTRCKDIVVVSGEDAYNIDVSKLKVWLARHSRDGVRLVAIGTGAIILARAGVIKGTSVALHPWYRFGFSELFPDILLSSRTHVSEGRLCSASGGTSSIDLFLDFIEQDQDAALANLVAESMCYRQTRLLQAAADLGAPNAINVLHPLVSKAISAMEKSIEFPVSPSLLAQDLNISTRQLERLFKKYIGQSPKRKYVRIRLEESYRLLVQTRLEITEVGLMTGFRSPSHFSKCFRAEFAVTPYELRRRPSSAKH